MGWIVISHIGRREEQNTIYKGVKTFPYQTSFKASLEWKPERESPKRTISAGGGFGLLQFMDRIDINFKKKLFYYLFSLTYSVFSIFIPTPTSSRYFSYYIYE